MSPFQHGEVLSQRMDAETDLDLGYYERFLRRAKMTKLNNFTSGRVYQDVLNKNAVVTTLVELFAIPYYRQHQSVYFAQGEGYDVAIVEIGGTVGDIESPHSWNLYVNPRWLN